jgi:chemotaxis protein MotB
MARKKREMGSGGNWMDTYGDMVTLLFTFFVCLYSMASMSDEKWYELVKAFNTTGSEKVEQIVFAVTEQEGKEVLETMSPHDNPEPGDKTVEAEIFNNIYMLLQKYVTESGHQGAIIVEKDSQDSQSSQSSASAESASRIYLSFNNTILFEPDEAILLEEAYDPLSVIGGFLKEYDSNIGKIIIKGFTADSPNSTVDAFELSGDRSTAVYHYLKNTEGVEIPEAKMMSINHGSQYPIAPNDTESNRRLNRRVEIVIIPASAYDANDEDLGSHFSKSPDVIPNE